MKWLYLLLLFFGLVIFMPSVAGAQNVQNFSFDSFNADYYLGHEADGSSKLDVNETLEARFPNIDQNHGILRAIPEEYDGHSLSLRILSVTDQDNVPYHYVVMHQNHNSVLKIGDADKYVHGLKIYKISYLVRDITVLRNSQDQWFWNINGDQWLQPFGVVTANVHIPNSLTSLMVGKPICYQGYFGSQSQACTINRQDQQLGGQIITFMATNLQPRQTLSVGIPFKAGTFTKSSQLKHQESAQKISLVVGAILAVILPLYAFIFMFRRWRQFGDDPKGRGVIIPEYEPPQGLDALRSDFLYKQALRSTAITATILELAVQGYLTIREIPKHGLFGSKDYELTLEGDPQMASPPVKDLLTTFGLLAPGTKLKLSDQKKKQTTTHAAMEKLEKNLSKSLFSDGYFLKDSKSVKAGYLTWAFLIFIASFGAGFVGFKFEIWAIAGLAFGLGMAALIVFIYAFFMPARSQKGVEAYDQLLGLKDYIKLAEAERLRYLQSPEGAEKIQDKEAFNPQEPAAKIKLFEKLLPYAVIFGLEKDWAKQFNDLYVTPPNWYHGNWTTFNAAYLASSIGDFNSFGGQIFAPPSSSGSGFSGGAGGGGGGGGGGGW